MAFIEERDEYAKEEAEEEKQAMELKEGVRLSHPFSFGPSSSSSQHKFNQAYFGPSSIYEQSVGASSSGAAAGEAACEEEREHMFDKVVTPSDVGKLNRLVIPKQHAEKYFPLDSSANEKGLLLNFEDRSGKPWRFRYSYWNSSQSYVMTKGWSRFVKEKKLDAGDIVSFERCVGKAGQDRFYIDWRRRPNMADPSLHGLPVHHRSVPWGRLFFPPIPRSHIQFNYGYNVMNPAALNCLRPAGGPMVGGGLQYARSTMVSSPMVFESVPLVHSAAAAAVAGKRVRLFGVNLDCPTGEEADRHDDNVAKTAHTLLLPIPEPQVQPSPPSQLRLYSGGPSISGELQRKPKPSLSLDLDI